MFEAIVFIRLLVLGVLASVGLGYLDDLKNDRIGTNWLPHIVLGGLIALFVWLMGWLG